MIASVTAGIRSRHIPKISDVAVQQWYELQFHLRDYKHSHTGHCTPTAESENIEVQNTFKGEITLYIA